MKIKLKILFIALLPLLVASCGKKDNLDIEPPANLGGEIIKPTNIDQWILDNLTTPYNINVKYRWDPFDLALDKTLTPPDESKIIPAMDAIKRVWIDVYNAETGSDMFMKKLTPKQFKLVGSVEYNYNGTVILGQAEGGNNIVFFDINQNFDQDPVSSIRRMIHTSHHEFAHVLHQNVMYPQEFKGISARLGMDGYTATWFNVPQATAFANGYITSYAMSGYDDDFAEMVAEMLVLGKTGFDELVDAQNGTAQNAFRQKEQIIVNYFRDIWGIDFYSLQTRVQNAIADVTDIPSVSEVFAYNTIFNAASFNPATRVFLPRSDAFQAIFETSAQAVAELPEGYTLDSLQLLAIDDTTTYLLFYLTQGATESVGLFGLDDRTLPNGNHFYSIFGADPVGAEIQGAVIDILLYFNERQFTLSWYAAPILNDYPRVKFSPADAPGDYFTGRLLFVP